MDGVSPDVSLHTVYLAESKKAPVESPVVTTGLWRVKSRWLRRIPVALRGWCWHQMILKSVAGGGYS